MLNLPPGAMQRYSGHLDEISSVLPIDGALDAAELAQVQFVFLCFTNRCGSNFIAETLASSGHLNLGWECWNAAQVIRAARDAPLASFQDYVRGMFLDGMRNGRFVSKLAIEHVVLLHVTGVLGLVVRNSRFILIERDDKLGQAVSLAIANATGGWSSYSPPMLPASDVPFSREVVTSCLELILDQTALFKQFFAANGIVPLHLTYEAFMQSPDRMTRQVGSALGLPGLANVPANVRTKRQSDAVNRRWRDLYAAAD